MAGVIGCAQASAASMPSEQPLNLSRSYDGRLPSVTPTAWETAAILVRIGSRCSGGNATMQSAICKNLSCAWASAPRRVHNQPASKFSLSQKNRNELDNPELELDNSIKRRETSGGHLAMSIVQKWGSGRFQNFMESLGNP
jgi:hypothetical protein